MCYNKLMIRQSAFKYELRPNGAQARDMLRFAGMCRYVYNKALALQRELYVAEGRKYSYAELCKFLTQWRNDSETSWLALAPAQVLQQSVKNLDAAIVNCIKKRAAPPKPKKRGRCRISFRYPQAGIFKLDEVNSRIYLPKLGWMRYRNSRPVVGDIKNATVSLKAGRWYVSIQTEREVEVVERKHSKIVGLDVGVARFVTSSEGWYVEPLNAFKRLETALRKANQALSRKKKFSKNWYKALRKVQRLYAKIANARHDFLHKLSTHIVETQDVVCAEDLQVKNMSASASGTVEAPGKHVAQKRGLNKAILDQGFSEFIRMLDYKLAWSGGQLILVPPHYTSQTCPACGHVSKENRKTQAEFRCVECGYEGHADHVAAMNIKARGLEILEQERVLERRACATVAHAGA